MAFLNSFPMQYMRFCFCFRRLDSVLHSSEVFPALVELSLKGRLPSVRTDLSFVLDLYFKYVFAAARVRGSYIDLF